MQTGDNLLQPAYRFTGTNLIWRFRAGAPQLTIAVEAKQFGMLTP